MVIPVSPAIVRVCPVVNVSFDPLSAARVKLEFTVAHCTPVPVDCKYCPFVPVPELAVRVPVRVRSSAVPELIVGEVSVLFVRVSVPVIVAYDNPLVATDSEVVFPPIENETSVPLTDTVASPM